MGVDVQVTDDGKIQATVDGITGPALSIDTLQAMAAKVPAARNRLRTHEFAGAVRGLTEALLAGPPTIDATIVVQPGVVSATVDPGTFEVMRSALGVEPDPVTGALVAGFITVQTADPIVTPVLTGG